jgi:hypothetical protein
MKYHWTIRFFAGSGRQTIIYRENGINCRGAAGFFFKNGCGFGV